MKPNQLIPTKTKPSQDLTLKEQIEVLQKELDEISNKLERFETQLSSQLTNELIAEQELSVLYKAQKAEKKDKRLAQKRKGKKYVEPVGLKIRTQSPKVPNLSEDDAREKKRLYREAMLHVHPDKFSMNDDKVDLATVLTTRLVEIYQYEDLATLRAYHTHLFSNAQLLEDSAASYRRVKLTTSPDAYLIKEKEQLEVSIESVKSKYTYHVLTTYKAPSTFINELRSYYQDRINKLRRRTRTKSQ